MSDVTEIVTSGEMTANKASSIIGVLRMTQSCQVKHETNP